MAHYKALRLLQGYVSCQYDGINHTYIFGGVPDVESEREIRIEIR